MEPVVDAIFVSSRNTGTDCLQVYDCDAGTQLKSYRGQPAASSTLCSVGHAAYLLSAQRDKPFLQSWAIHQHDLQQMRIVVPGKVTAMAVNSAGQKYCVIGINEKIYMYKLLSGRLIGIAVRHYQPVTQLEFSPCGNFFASGGEDGFVYLWSLCSFMERLHQVDAPQPQPHFVLGHHSDKVTGLTFAGCGMRGFLVSSSLDHTARVFDLVTGRPVYSLVTGGAVTSVAVNALGSQLFLGHADGTVKGMDLLPAPPIGDVEVSHKGVLCHEKAVRHLAVTATGNHLVSGGDDGEVKVWVVTSATLGTPKAAPNSPPHLAHTRTVHTGRGPITNLAIKQISREVLNATDMTMEEVIAPFTQDYSNPLGCPVTVPIKGHCNPHPQLADIFTPPFQLSPPAVVGGGGEAGGGSEGQTTVEQLKMTNNHLFKFALKHIIGEGDL
ncbi:WD repeat-containing protein 18 [Chionoecetes opilio]|uniref:WD repeat-containing protein 18 n=1 Tax=Chionoecetes opilio TaxID=41210 RepID=A0A8J4XWA6_CHIOP|nr:WD repeat-containing protein 18 [Chionoecetes opilio]